MAKLYNKKPSELLYIEDCFVAYCFDDAVAEFISLVEEGRTPKFPLTEDEKIERRQKNSGLQTLIAMKK